MITPKIYRRCRKAWIVISTRRKPILVSLLVCIATVALVVLFVLKPTLRPYLIVLVAAIGALLAAVLPSLLIDSPFVRWLIATVAAVCVGVGTWYTVVEFDRKAAELQRQVSLYHELLLSLNRLPPSFQQALILHLAQTMRATFRADRFDDVGDLADIESSLDNQNGHALYYKGEVHRVAADFESMRGAFNQYLSAAGGKPWALTGLAEEGYTRTDGYFGERTAFIEHLMADDAYRQALKTPNLRRKKDLLMTAQSFAERALTLWRQLKRDNKSSGFDPTKNLEGTSTLLENISEQLELVRQQLSGMPIRP